MKKLILCFAIVIASLSCLAQGNLQFNQVINLEAWSNVFAGPGYKAEVSFTVPAGKIWKIEGATSTCLSNGIGQIDLTNTLNNRNYGNIHSKGNISTVQPIWLKSGFTGKFSSSAGGCYYINEGGFIISILEFNIVP